MSVINKISYGSLPQNHGRKCSHMTACLPALKYETPASAFNGIFHHGNRRSMQICLCAGFFKVCNLRRHPSCKKRIGNLIFFYHFKVLFHRGIERFNSHKPCSAYRHIFGGILQHIICKVFRKASNRKKRQGSMLKNSVGKITIV